MKRDPGRKKERSVGEDPPAGYGTLAEIGRMSAGIAHQLRNPLGVIRTAVWNIRRKRTNPDIDRHLDNIEKKIDQGVGTLEDLLEFTRIGEPDRSRFELSRLLEEMIERSFPEVPRTGPAVRADLSNLSGMEIEADRDHIRRALSDILENALEASGEGGPVSIEAALLEGEAVISFVLEDSGSDAGDIGRIFEPFRSSRPGTALGLSLARLLMEANGGRVEAERLGRSRAAFRAYIPLAGRTAE